LIHNYALAIREGKGNHVSELFCFFVLIVDIVVRKGKRKENLPVCLLSFDLIAMPFVFVLARNCNQMPLPCLVGSSKRRRDRKDETPKQECRNVRKED
jgi:hypothetical protein